MNIFVIDEDPYIAAIHLHNRHVVKMILESAQMLSTCHHVFNNKLNKLLKPVFINHPCTKWVRESKSNYIWLFNHFKALLEEYNYRYDKNHFYEILLDVLNEPPEQLQDKGLTAFAQAMPDIFKNENSIKAYRKYYLINKIYNNYWLKRRYELKSWLTDHLYDDQYLKTNINKLNFRNSKNDYDVNKDKEYIFVFGSNLAGKHGKGAAKFAIKYCNAEYGKAIGLQGNSYAIPTKDENLKVLDLNEINKYVNDFLLYARKCIFKKFYVTRIGCGLAGYQDIDIAPMFINATSNVLLPYEWKNIVC